MTFETDSECRQVSQYIVKYIVKRREARPFSVRFIWAFPVQEIQKMEQRDWKLLDKQVQGLRPPRNDGVMVLMVVAVRWHDPRRPPIPHKRELMRIASNDARTAISLPNSAPPTKWR